MIATTLDAQAHLWAFIDNFRVFSLLAFSGVPLIWLFRRVKRAPAKKVDVAAH